jgi:hypothetical protein
MLVKFAVLLFVTYTVRWLVVTRRTMSVPLACLRRTGVTLSWLFDVTVT